MTRRFLWGLLAVVMAFGTAGCGAKETPAPATVSGQPAGAERRGGEKRRRRGSDRDSLRLRVQKMTARHIPSELPLYPATVICIILC